MVRPVRHSEDEILAIAREVFIERGPSVSLAVIAARLGLSQPALSQRFGSKRALLLRALAPTQQLDRLLELSEGPDARPFDVQLHALARAALELLEEAIPTMMTLRLAGPEVLAGTAGELELPHEQVRVALVGYFARAQQRELVRALAPAQVTAMFIGSLQAMALQAYVSGEPVDPAAREAAIEGLVDLFMWGVAKRAQP